MSLLDLGWPWNTLIIYLILCMPLFQWHLILNSILIWTICSHTFWINILRNAFAKSSVTKYNNEKIFWRSKTIYVFSLLWPKMNTQPRWQWPKRLDIQASLKTILVSASIAIKCKISKNRRWPLEVANMVFQGQMSIFFLNWTFNWKKIIYWPEIYILI